MKVDQIIQRARDITGLEHFDNDSFMEGLAQAIDAINTSHLLKEEARVSLLDLCNDALCKRLQITEYARCHPATLQQVIDRPLFVLGLPRSGSTLLSNLLNLDPKIRSLLRWEAAEMSPPCAAGMLKRDPRCLRRMQEETDPKNLLKHIHYEAWDGPTECHHLLTQDFKSVGLETPLASPAYGEWLLKCDTVPTYRYHKKCLQILQTNTPGIWCLKQASHALNITALQIVYPDARIIWTHRDPCIVLASFMEMAVAVQKIYSGEPSLDYIAQYSPKRLGEHVRRLMAVQDSASKDPFFHLFYNDFIRDPIAQIRILYAEMGDKLSPTVERAMLEWLRDNPKNKFGPHSYDLDTFGLTRNQVKAYFEDYIERFQL